MQCSLLDAPDTLGNMAGLTMHHRQEFYIEDSTMPTAVRDRAGERHCATTCHINARLWCLQRLCGSHEVYRSLKHGSFAHFIQWLHASGSIGLTRIHTQQEAAYFACCARARLLNSELNEIL